VGPLITSATIEQLETARRSGAQWLECSLDLQKSSTEVQITAQTWIWRDTSYPYPTVSKPRTIYYWDAAGFLPVARYSGALIKLVPTEWGAPTFEIDGIKMLPTALVSPYADAQRKVALIRPRGKTVLDTCGGLGYFADWCLRGAAARVLSFEKSPDVIWLRGNNPWSPAADDRLTLTNGDVSQAIGEMPANSVDAVLHDPPRFGIAGELYSRNFYQELARVTKRRGWLFHYTGAPNKHSSGRDLAQEVVNRLRQAGFNAEKSGDGILAQKS
jgi:uncharacterized protein